MIVSDLILSCRFTIVVQSNLYQCHVTPILSTRRYRNIVNFDTLFLDPTSIQLDFFELSPLSRDSL